MNIDQGWCNSTGKPRGHLGRHDFTGGTFFKHFLLSSVFRLFLGGLLDEN
jgi:hypothetical protein